jgi:type IV secretion system protein TrbL
VSSCAEPAPPGGLLRRIIRLLVFSALLAGAVPVPAQGQVPTAGYPGLAELVGRPADAAQQGVESLRDNPRIASVGTLLSGFFLVLLLVWSAIKCMAAGRGLGELLAAWVPILVSFAVVYLILERSAGSLLVQFMDSLASAIGGQDLSSLRDALSMCVRPVLAAAVQVLDMPSMASGSLEGQGWAGSLVAGATHWVVGTLARTGVALLLVVASSIMALHVMIGFVSVQLVLTLAPVMVPFLMFQPAAWLFDSWLRFLLGACLLKVVMAFLLTVTGRILAVLDQQVQSARTQPPSAGEAPVSDLLLYLTMVLVALLATLLVSQALPIATGLVSGSAGGAGFRGLNGGSRALGAALRSGGQRAGSLVLQSSRRAPVRTAATNPDNPEPARRARPP